MIGEKTCERLELNKILARAAEFCVLEGGRERVLSTRPVTEFALAKRELDLTEEAERLLFRLGAGGTEYFAPVGDKAERAEKGATLTCGELVELAGLLRSARVSYKAITSLADEKIVLLLELAEKLHFDESLEQDVGDKIIGENELADTASDRLYSIRRELRLLNEKIRARLSEYLSGEEKKYLQDSIVTVRGDRFVLPVKAEYKRSVKGFVHDRSATGATFFIEPEEVLELNNELRSLKVDEKEEEERILKELSRRFGEMRENLEQDEELLSRFDSLYAKAEYGYKTNSQKPMLNAEGRIDIVKGRHPLLDVKKAVPVSLSLGKEYRFLVVSGANTGGKTVALKMCGLFSLMAASGLFVPAALGSELSVFGGVYCDLGDSQSIEENLSTFSSHVTALKEIVEKADKNSLVLIDEPGGGTDPEEGQALACAIVETLVKSGAKGIVTTHFSALKEYALGADGVENGCMEFDSATLKPLYRLKQGVPGTSNALAICTRLGLPDSVVEAARARLSEGAKNFENTLRVAEESRIAAEEAERIAKAKEAEWEKRLSDLERDEEKFKAEKEKFSASSRAEARRIIGERTARAEELLSEIEEIFSRESMTEGDLIRARTLKNKLADTAYEEEEEGESRRLPVEFSTLNAGDIVFVGSLNAEGKIITIKREKKEAQIACGALKVWARAGDLYKVKKSPKKQKEESVRIVRKVEPRMAPSTECNVIGLTVAEALPEVEALIDGALLSGLTEVRIVHGMGTGKLRAGIHSYLRGNTHVESFRLGKYGEGESGVTVVTLK